MYATVEELENHLGETFDAARAARAEQALELASGWVDEAGGRIRSQVIDATQTFVGGTVAILLPDTPATVSAVTINGEAFTNYTVEGFAGILRRTDGYRWPANVTVTYSTGSDDIPSSVKIATLEAAKRILASDPNGTATQKTVGDVSVSYASPQALNEWELSLLGRFATVA
jgi:hypothetical protein